MKKYTKPIIEIISEEDDGLLSGNVTATAPDMPWDNEEGEIIGTVEDPKYDCGCSCNRCGLGLHDCNTGDCGFQD